MNTTDRPFRTSLHIKNTDGFSLIEMIVVVAILAVMVLVLAPKLLSYNERSRAEKDNSTMDEVVNAIQLAMADQEIYDEVLRFSTVDNISCYVDTNSEANYAKIVTKKNPNGIDQYTFTSDARQLDETPYFAAGNMRGVTITFAPNKGSNGSTFDLKQGVVNQYIQVSGNQRFGALPKLYSRVKSNVGEKVINTSQTYRNSEYTVFIVMGTIGGNDESAQDATRFYGQWSGTNLPQQVSYQLVTDRITGDDGKQIVEIDDTKWNETNGNKITVNPGDLNGGGSYSSGTQTGNQTDDMEDDNNPEIPEIPLSPGLYDENDNLIVSWEESGINAAGYYSYENYKTSKQSGYYVTQITYPNTRKVVLPNDLTKVSVYLFGSCTGLTDVFIPDSVTSVGDHSFYECSGLTSIRIPNSVTVVDNYAFSGCSGLKSIVIGNSVANIGTSAFDRCTSLEAIDVDDRNIYYGDGNGSNCIIDKENLKLVSGCKNTIIPHGVKSIGDSAFFRHTELKEIIIPNSVVSIENRAFQKTGLTSVIIPSSVNSIGLYAFYQCEKLVNVEFNDTEIWYTGSSLGATTTELNSSELLNSSTSASYLKSSFYNKYWTKKEGTQSESVGIVYAYLTNDDTLILRNSERLAFGDIKKTYGKIPVDNSRNWDSDKYTIKKVKIETPLYPTSCYKWFFDQTDTTEFVGLDKIDTSRVTNMGWMFSGAGYDITTTLDLDISNWNTSNVKYMQYMFASTASRAETFQLDLSCWDVGNVDSAEYMFYRAGEYSKTFSMDLSNWNTENVTDMDSMFQYAGYKADTWCIGDVSGWDVGNVYTMAQMFQCAGSNNATFPLDLSGWDVSKVQYYGFFGAENITPPVWVR